MASMLSLPACSARLPAPRTLRAAHASAREPMAVRPAPQQQPGQQQRQRQRQRRWRHAAGRGGGADRDSDSESEDYFRAGEGVSSGEYYDDDDLNAGDEEEDLSEIRLYLDSADVEEWKQWAEAGLFYGFTTNPTILKRDGVACNITSMRQLTREAFSLGVSELQLQAWGTTAEEMYACGLDLMDLDGRIAVKLPLTLPGAKAARRLIANGVPVTMTGVYARHQVVTALALGAAYCAPYVGRMTDAGKNGVEEAIAMQRIVDLGSGDESVLEPMRLLVASLRSADEIAALAAEGCNTFTISPAVAQQLFDVQATIDAAAVFQAHADEMGAMRGH